MILTIVVFIFVLGLLVIVHEVGHFISAKLSGVKVEEFAFGFPPRIWSKKIGETKFSINLIPLGGYVKMLGEDEVVKQPRSFSAQSVTKKAVILVSGVIMNLVLAWFLLTIGFAVGMSPLLSTPESLGAEIIRTKIIIAEVKKDSPADKSGIIQSDQIVYIIDQFGQKTVLNSNKDITSFTTSHKNQQVKIGIIRDEVQKEVIASLSADELQPLGIAAIDDSLVRMPWYKAPGAAVIETGKIFKLTYDFVGNFFKNIFTKGEVSKDVGGPVSIYVYTGMAVKLGVMAVIQFIAILSVNLALINILPFPALDGGKLLFLILRKVIGKHFIEERIENIIHLVGFAFLIVLMILITFKDVMKFF